MLDGKYRRIKFFYPFFEEASLLHKKRRPAIDPTNG
jgi:hypothetical protein